MEDKSTSTSCMGAPEFPGITSPSIDLNGAVKVGIWITWGFSSTALTPVDLSELRLTLLICQSPTSVDPLVL